MTNDLGDPVLMHNGCLILCQFQIPSDVLFDYTRMVQSLNIIQFSSNHV